MVGILVVSALGLYVAMVPMPSRGTAGGSAPTAAIPAPTSPNHFGHPNLQANPAQSLKASGTVGCPYAAAQCYYSYNWGGYVVYKSTYLVSKVVGSWTVPTIAGVVGSACPDVQMTWDSNSVWIGIDGFSGGTVEQTGTSADCFYGVVNYYAWYEFYPAGSVVAFTVHPGDAIKATVSYTGTSGGVPQFKTTITDSTTSTTKTSPTTGVTGALRNSAEWIDEAPYYDGILGLTQVNAIKFTAATATIGGVTGSISHWGTNVYWILMIDYNFPNSSSTATLTYAKAQPAALTSLGKDFVVKWLTDGP
jgi:Peptidase A4 family